MTQKNTFTELFSQAVGDRDPKEVARLTGCQPVTIRGYLGGKLPRERIHLDKLQPIFPVEQKWRELNEAWARESAEKLIANYPRDAAFQNIQPSKTRTGQCIIDLRIESGMTQNELNSELGTIISALTYIEAGDVLPAPPLFSKIYTSSLCATEANKRRLRDAFETDLLVAKDGVVR